MTTDVLTELYTGSATGWVAGSVYTRDNLAISRGTSDESTSAVPSTAAFTLNNRLNNWDPRNPTGLYYGQIGKNTPCRITHTTLTDSFARTVASGWGTAPGAGGIPGQAWTAFGSGGTVLGTDTFVSGGLGQHSVPATNAYRLNVITGETYLDVDVRVDCQALSGTNVTGGNVEPANVILRYTSSSAYYMARVTIDTTQQVNIGILYADGTVLAASVPVTGLTHAGGNTLRVRAQAEGQSIRAKVWDAAKVEPYDWQVLGNYIQLGKPVADAPGGFGVRSGVATGNTNTLPVVFQYSNLIVSVPRFAGEVGDWVQGADQTNQDRYVKVDAAGPLRRLGQPSAPVLKSVLRRSIPALGSQLVAYWPCEDGANATSIASGLPNGVPMAIVGAPTLASYSGFPSSLPIPVMAAAGTTSSLVGTVPLYAATGSWQVRCLVFASNGVDGSTILRVTTTGTAQTWDVSFSTGGNLKLKVYDQAGTNILDSAIGFAINNVAFRLSLQAAVSGSDINYTVSILAIGIGASAGYATGTLTAHSTPSVAAVSINPFSQCGNFAFGQISVESVVTDIFALAAQFNAYADETAIDRMIRLCGENTVNFDFTSNPLAPALMGPQKVDTLLNLLNEAAALDMGQLCETRGRVGLLYLGLGPHYNQSATLTVDATQLASPPQPVDDDQQTHNDITVTRQDGSSANVALTTGRLSTLPAGQGGIGDYPIGPTLNAFADSQLPDLASWLLHLGTVDAARYPQLPMRFVHPPSAARRALFLAALAVTMPNKIVATSLTPDALSLIMRGYSETYTFSTPGLIDFVFNCVPGSPYDILTLDDPILGRLGSTTTTLHDTTISPTATSFQVDIGDGTLWTTNAGDWPVKIKMGGEVMSVGAISGTSSPQTFSSVTRSVNGVVKSHATGEQVDVAQPVYLALGRA
jgi:hypothetical protein